MTEKRTVFITLIKPHPKIKKGEPCIANFYVTCIGEKCMLGAYNHVRGECFYEGPEW